MERARSARWGNHRYSLPLRGYFVWGGVGFAGRRGRGLPGWRRVMRHVRPGQEIVEGAFVAVQPHHQRADQAGNAERDAAQQTAYRMAQEHGPEARPFATDFGDANAHDAGG